MHCIQQDLQPPMRQEGNMPAVRPVRIWSLEILSKVLPPTPPLPKATLPKATPPLPKATHSPVTQSCAIEDVFADDENGGVPSPCAEDGTGGSPRAEEEDVVRTHCEYEFHAIKGTPLTCQGCSASLRRGTLSYVCVACGVAQCTRCGSTAMTLCVAAGHRAPMPTNRVRAPIAAKAVSTMPSDFRDSARGHDTRAGIAAGGVGCLDDDESSDEACAPELASQSSQPLPSGTVAGSSQAPAASAPELASWSSQPLPSCIVASDAREDRIWGETFGIALGKHAAVAASHKAASHKTASHIATCLLYTSPSPRD